MIESIREWDLTVFEKLRVPDYSATAIELGSGNGQFIVDMAHRNPDFFYFAVERLAEYVNKTKRKAERYSLKNLFLINGDIFTCMERFFNPEQFDSIYINFPDPWVKKSHLKKRVVQDRMMPVYSRFLKKKGRFYFVTDDIPYRDEGIQSIFASGLFEPVFDDPFYTTDLPDYPVTLYESKWRKEGRGIFYSVFIKK